MSSYVFIDQFIVETQYCCGRICKIGGNGKFFGAITNKEIADKLFEMGYDIDKKKIVLDSNIKTVGVYKVNFKISPEETAKITVEVSV